MSQKEERLEESISDQISGAYCLFRGVPGPDTLAECQKLVKKASEFRLADESLNDNLLFQYGPEDGDPEYLDELTKFLTREYGAPVDRDHLVTTAGATSGLLHLLSLLFPNKCNVFVEEVSYFLGINAMEKELKYDLISVPLEDDGIDIEAFEKLIIDLKNNNTYEVPSHGFWSAFYLIPHFHNPTGRSLSLEKSKRLIQLSQEHKILLICEDVYNLLYYAESPLVRLFALDDRKNQPGCVVSNCSFSKYLAPGLRLGWIEMPLWIKQIWMTSSLLISGGCLNMYTSGITGSAMKHGLVSEFVQSLRDKYSKRMKEFCDTLKNQMPPGCSFQQPNGGYFVWVEMPNHCHSTKLNKLSLLRHKITFQDGWKFAPKSSKKDFNNCFRISISYYNEDILRDCATKLCSLMKEII